MRSTLSGFSKTWALAGCLALFLGCSQGEGDRCEIDSDCSGDLKCEPTGSPHNGICRPPLGAGGNSGQGSTAVSTSTSTSTSTGTSTGQPDAAVAPVADDAATDASESDGSLAD